MKKNLLLSVAIMFACLSASAQINKDSLYNLNNIPLPTDSLGIIRISEVVKVDSADAATLFSNARKFFADTYVSNKAVIDMVDANTNTIIAKPYMKIFYGYMGQSQSDYIRYQFTIQCKDGRYKYTIENFVVEDIYGKTIGPFAPSYHTFYASKKGYYNYFLDCYNQTAGIIEALKKQMASKSGTDW